MPHHIYKTRGWIVDGVAVGEAHRYITVFTSELGIIRVLARSARMECSKLRQHIQTLCLGEYSFVRGRDVWRLTGARVDRDLYHELATEPRALLMFSRYASLLKRLLGSEDPHPGLLPLLEDSVSFVRTAPADGEALENLECLLVLRTLMLLGYVGESPRLNGVLVLSPITADTLEEIAPVRRHAIAEINRALKESQL